MSSVKDMARRCLAVVFRCVGWSWDIGSAEFRESALNSSLSSSIGAACWSPWGGLLWCTAVGDGGRDCGGSAALDSVEDGMDMRRDTDLSCMSACMSPDGGSLCCTADDDMKTGDTADFGDGGADSISGDCEADFISGDGGGEMCIALSGRW